MKDVQDLTEERNFLKENIQNINNHIAEMEFNQGNFHNSHKYREESRIYIRASRGGTEKEAKRDIGFERRTIKYQCFQVSPT